MNLSIMEIVKKELVGKTLIRTEFDGEDGKCYHHKIVDVLPLKQKYVGGNFTMDLVLEDGSKVWVFPHEPFTVV